MSYPCRCLRVTARCGAVIDSVGGWINKLAACPVGCKMRPVVASHTATPQLAAALTASAIAERGVGGLNLSDDGKTHYTKKLFENCAICPCLKQINIIYAY